MDKGRRIALANKAKALNHWACDGSGKDPNATIKDCSLACRVPGLVAYARSENRLKTEARNMRLLESRFQREKDAAESEAANESMSESVDNGFVRVVPPGSIRKPPVTKQGQRNASEQIGFVNRFNSKLDRSIANLVIEEATPLVFPTKPAFREMIDAAIEYGAFQHDHT
jgi:hypothetical protein